MSDSESDSDYGIDWKDSRHQIYDTIITLHPSEGVFDRWGSIPADTKKEAGQRMKICTFWLPILLQYEESSDTARWAVQMGLLDAIDREDISLKQLHKIEILEAILRALETGSLKWDQTKHIFWISNMFNLRSPEVLEDALHWLERTGETAIRHRVLEFGHEHTCFTALQFIFTEFAKYIHAMGSKLEKTMRSLMAQPPDHYIEKSEEMKQKGNENFQKNQYEDAADYYTRAIIYYPDNHIIYGNRALCYIRSKKYLKAVVDGKRAILIKPLWAKGHYRYCDALFLLGEVTKAIEANGSAQSLCKDDQQGLKDLKQQHLRFITEIAERKAGKPRSKNKRPTSTNRADAAELRQQSKTGLVTNVAPQSKISEVKLEMQQGKNAQIKGTTNDSKPSKSQVSAKNEKVKPSITAKKTSKNRNDQSEVKNQTVADSKASVCKRLRTIVQDAHIALADLRSRNAEQAFSQSLAILETNTPKDIGLTKMDVIILLYGRASALTEIGQPEELAEAQKLMEKMKSFEERTVQCLVYYAIGRVYLKENRFALALEQFSNSLQMVKNQITPGKLTWPLTKETVKETEPEYFKEILDRAIELCKFPPRPDGICRLEKCQGFLKAEIYLTDPDFKGFIQLHCCQSCTIEYHITCWKTLRSTTFFEKSEKDFLQEPCLTPDCIGQICSIKITGPTGLLKCKFEAAIPKPQIPKKPKVNQKCSSLKKLKLKAELRLKRKQEKQFQDKQTINDETVRQTDGSASQSQQKAWLLYRDRVLLQISQKMELLREEAGLHVSDLISSLKPWLKVDSLRGNQLAERMLNWQEEQLETFGQAVELLLERKNRVWARVLIQLLSSSLNINPKLGNWACQLNESGLNAAKCFIERHTRHLETLDLALLLNFGPLQEMVMDKLGTRPELFSSIGLNLTDYLKQAGPHDMRLFIWTLEEHRDEYLTCHNILDDYFDMMDGHCSVLKKSDENQNNSPLKGKSRGRKKKHKEPKGFYVFPGSRVATPRDDQDFFEDDSLSFLHPDSFSVPSHLREQVADFENQYNSTRQGSYYKHFLDNNPDPTKETLYDYFAQILEEHGPLVAEDPLLVGELENFPPVAQLTIEQAGGFESFLLESLRFIKMGECIGLAKHAVSLQQAGHGASLDDLDLIVDPNTNNIHPNLQQPVFTSQNVSSEQANAYVTLPSPYIFFPPARENTSSVGIFTGNQSFAQWSNGDSQQHAHYFSYEDSGELDPLVTESGVGVLEMDPSTGGVVSLINEEGILKKHAAVQTCPETMSSVAVNTELHERFETNQGDINRKEKRLKQLEQQINEMENGCNKVNPKHKEDIAFLEEDIQKITANIQVTNKELTLFQQKLEEDLKMDQKEKKANQEVLKALKLEIEGLVEENASLTRSIREKNANYEAKLNDFLELSNQSAAEKLSLEDEIKRCKALCTSATRRSLTAQVSVVESSRDQGLHSLYGELADAKAFLTKLDDAIYRYPNQDLEISRSTWKSNLQEVEKKISAAEKLYQEQIGQVKNGRRVTELFLSNMNNQSEPPGQLAAALPATEVQPALIQTQHEPSTGTPEPPKSTFDKAMERLATIFPDYTRSDLMRYVQELRSSSGGSFSSMALQDLVGGVTQLILDHQEKLNHARANIVGRGSPAQCDSLPLVTPATVWQPVGLLRTVHPKALNVEDPCIICHDDMSPDDICVLECRHSFHNECIRSWLKEQSTCPTCRDHALLPDDFPSLPGRRRRAL